MPMYTIKILILQNRGDKKVLDQPLLLSEKVNRIRKNASESVTSYDFCYQRSYFITPTSMEATIGLETSPFVHINEVGNSLQKWLLQKGMGFSN